MSAEDHNKSDIAIIAALRNKARDLIDERRKLHDTQVAVAEKIRIINNELMHLMNAARIFGDVIPVAASTAPPPSGSVQPRAETVSGPRPEVEKPAVETKIPKIKDLVLDRLKAAGAGGAKASEIRHFIEATYEVQIHEKTVGMNLYRFLKQGKARRDGIFWFFVPPGAEKKNPGGDAPGIEDLLG